MKRLSRKYDLPKAILDIKGTLIHMLARGEDPDALLEEGGGKVNTAGFGFNNWLEEYFNPILEEHSPQQIIAVWDGGHVYRSGLYSGYKDREKSEPPVKTKQLDKLYAHVKTFLASLGVTQCTLEGQEADDVIAFLCERIPEFKSVYTVDRDLLQLSNDTTLVYFRGNAEGDFKGYPTNLTTLFKSLVGDTSDCIPGVKGFGEAAFAKLVNAYGVDGMYELEACVKKGNFAMLEEAIKQTGDKNLQKIYDQRYADAEAGIVGWQTCYKLASLAPWLCERRVNGKLPQLTWFKRIPNRERCLDALSNLSSAYKMGDFEKYFGESTLITADNAHVVRDLLDRGVFASCHTVGYDLESYDTLKNPAFQEAKKTGEYIDVLSQLITGASFCYGDNLQHSIYISVRHKDTNNCDPALIVEVLEQCPALAVHNASFEIQVTKQCNDGYLIESPTDTAVMAVMLDEDEETGLKYLSKHYLNYTQITYEQVLESARQQNITQLLSAYPDAGAIYQSVLKQLEELEMFEAQLSELSGDEKKETKEKISAIRSNIKSLKSDPAYKKVADQIAQIESVDMDMSMITGEQAVEYGCDDAICSSHLHIMFDLFLTLERTRDFTYAKSFDPVHILNQSFEQGENIDFERLKELEIADDILIQENRKVIIDNLIQHCSFTNEVNAKEFFQADHQHYFAKWKQDKKGDSDDYIQFKWKQELAALVERTSYTPLEHYREPVEFIPTVTKLNLCCEALGIVDPIEKVSKSYLADWAVTAVSQDERASKFVNLLLAAVDELKARSGENYEKLATFCAEILTESAPLKTRGDELNFGSPAQMSDLLYLKLGLPVRHRTRPQNGSFRKVNRLPGSPATDEDCIMLAIANDTVEGDWRRTVLKALLAAKGALTRGSYYYKPYPMWAHPRDGRVHGSIRFPSTATRRPTASSPNLLQVTKLDGGKVRSAFRPTALDSVCVAIDFAGQELRITASESKDPVMLDAYLSPEKKDIHAVTAANICYLYLLQNHPEILKKLGLHSQSIVYSVFMQYYKGDDETVSKAFKAARTIAKTVNFLIIYGGGPNALSMKLSMGMEVCKQIMNQVMRAYARLEPWKEEVLDFGRTYGYVKTAFGNRRHLGNQLFAKDDGVRGHAERMAVNAVIQSCAADILTHVLSTAREERIFADTQADIHHKANGVVPIYDEIKAYCPVSSTWDYVVQMQRIMNMTPPGHAVPMLAEVSIGPTWGELTELGASPTRDAVMAAAISQVPGKLISLPPERKLEVA